MSCFETAKKQAEAEAKAAKEAKDQAEAEAKAAKEAEKEARKVYSSKHYFEILSS